MQKLKLTLKQFAEIKTMIKSRCCNCYQDNCLLLDDGDTHTCPQLITPSHIICRYFLDVVLPADKTLLKDLRSESVVMMVCSLCGRFNEDNIPMNFRDTPKSILNYCFTLKDCAIIIDDYHPGSGREQSAQDTTTQALIRGICNREARGALDKSGKQRAAKRPQCNVIMTAEYLPNVGESGVARFLSLELKPGDINLSELTKYQKEAEEGTLSHFTFLATEMLKAKFLDKENGVNELLGKLKSGFLSNRKFYKAKADEMNFHIRPRLCDDLANLRIGFELYCETLLYYEGITAETKTQ